MDVDLILEHNNCVIDAELDGKHVCPKVELCDRQLLIIIPYDCSRRREIGVLTSADESNDIAAEQEFGQLGAAVKVSAKADIEVFGAKNAKACVSRKCEVCIVLIKGH